MVYLDSFTFPDENSEMDFIWSEKKTCYDSFYPFRVLSARNFERIDFENITILYGGNGSGKSTALNVIAESINAERGAVYNKTNFFPDYVKLCKCRIGKISPVKSMIITSDDVFDYVLNIRCLNEGIDNRRDEIFLEYKKISKSRFKIGSVAEYEELKRVNDSRRKSKSAFVRNELSDNVRGYSNGESAYIYFTEKIDEDGIFILDEPENSLSPARQTELAEYIQNASRFYKCQFIISTHSPFFLAIPGAKIYDLDSNTAAVRRWYELENVRIYHDFFKLHEKEFEQ